MINTQLVRARSFLRTGFYAAVMSWIIAAGAAAQTGGPFDLSWNTIDGGGAASSGASFTLSGTIGQPDAGLLAGGSFILSGGFWPGASVPVVSVSIVSANPPTAAANPYTPGQPFRDVLDTGTTSALTAGIGGAGTAPQGTVQYAPIMVTFSAAPSPAPAVGNVMISCTAGPCPTVTAVSGSGVGPYSISLSGPIPPRQCATFIFPGTVPGQKLQYQSLPGDTNLDGSVNTLDLLGLVQAINSGAANLPVNLARYNIDRNTGTMPVNTQDLLRVVQLLNGVNTTQAFNGATVATCP
jgi:hypothetical protein